MFKINNKNTRTTSLTSRVYNIWGKPEKSGKSLEKLKNQRKPGKLREMSWKIKALRENFYTFQLVDAMAMFGS